MNVDGEVVGINTAIYSPSGGSVGIGFSVPTALAQPVIDQLQEFGETRRGWLGVHIQSVTDEIADSLGLDDARGALVANVTPGGPAEQAGLQAGDVILSFNGRAIGKMRELPRIVAETPVGKESAVVVWRKGAETTVAVTLGRLEEQEVATVAAQNGGNKTDAAAIDAMGLTVASLTDGLRKEYEIGEDVNGVVVTAVAEGGNAAKKGVLPGDVIQEINQDPVTEPGEVAAMAAAVREGGRDSVLILATRGGDRRFVVISLAPKE